MTDATPTVFVVDDDPAVRSALEAAGRHLRVAVEAYPTARTFLDQLSLDRYGCVVLDLKMPDIDGLEVQRILRERETCLPVIMISGHADVPTVVHAMRQGALTFLEKPFGLSEISTQIGSALEMAGQWRERWLRRRDARERLSRLTSAQRVVFDFLAAGLSNKQIAARLNLSLRAIEDRKARLIQSLQLNSLVELFELAAATDDVVPPHGGALSGAARRPRAIADADAGADPVV